MKDQHHPPAGGELDPSTVRIDKASGTVGYAWYDSSTLAYYGMAVGEAIPLDGSTTHTLVPETGWTGSDPDDFIDWVADVLTPWVDEGRVA